MKAKLRMISLTTHFSIVLKTLAKVIRKETRAKLIESIFKTIIVHDDTTIYTKSEIIDIETSLLKLAILVMLKNRREMCQSITFQYSSSKKQKFEIRNNAIHTSTRKKYMHIYF